jgi:hypothetical protein
VGFVVIEAATINTAQAKRRRREMDMFRDGSRLEKDITHPSVAILAHASPRASDQEENASSRLLRDDLTRESEPIEQRIYIMVIAPLPELVAVGIVQRAPPLGALR